MHRVVQQMSVHSMRLKVSGGTYSLTTLVDQEMRQATFSVRSLLAWAQKAEMTKDLELALKLTWYEKLCDDDKANARDMYHQVFARTMQ
jgi:hypothetical protein